MKAQVIKGMTLGLVAGFIVTLVDGLYMLTPNIYVPHTYPLFLITFNTIFWTVIGGLSGFFMWIFSCKRENFKEKEDFYWVLFFLLPFTIIYGLLGRVNNTAPPVFDSHLSIVWTSLILLFLIIFRGSVITSKSAAIFFILEVTAISALFNFCSNILQIPLIRKCIKYLFFQDMQLSYKEYLTLSQWYSIAVYAMGVLLILGLYLLAYFKVNFLNKKQNRVMVILCLIVSISLAGLFTVRRNRFVEDDYPPIEQKKTGEIKKYHPSYLSFWMRYVLIVFLSMVLRP